jgi:hypothetical protein
LLCRNAAAAALTVPLLYVAVILHDVGKLQGWGHWLVTLLALTYQTCGFYFAYVPFYAYKTRSWQLERGERSSKLQGWGHWLVTLLALTYQTCGFYFAYVTFMILISRATFR